MRVSLLHLVKAFGLRNLTLTCLGPVRQALVHLAPKRIAITGGYFGSHATIDIYKRSRLGDLPIIDLEDEFQPGDLCWLETPVNPTGESRSVCTRQSSCFAFQGR